MQVGRWPEDSLSSEKYGSIDEQAMNLGYSNPENVDTSNINDKVRPAEGVWTRNTHVSTKTGGRNAIPAF
jgi:hypothetical protein